MDLSICRSLLLLTCSQIGQVIALYWFLFIICTYKVLEYCYDKSKNHVLIISFINAIAYIFMLFVSLVILIDPELMLLNYWYAVVVFNGILQYYVMMTFSSQIWNVFLTIILVGLEFFGLLTSFQQFRLFFKLFPTCITLLLYCYHTQSSADNIPKISQLGQILSKLIIEIIFRDNLFSVLIYNQFIYSIVLSIILLIIPHLQMKVALHQLHVRYFYILFRCLSQLTHNLLSILGINASKTTICKLHFA